MAAHEVNVCYCSDSDDPDAADDDDDTARAARERFLGGLGDIQSHARLHSAALVLAGDFNVHGVRTRRQEVPATVHKFPRWCSVAAEGTHRFALLFEQFLDGQFSDDLPFHVLHDAAWTRRPFHRRRDGDDPEDLGRRQPGVPRQLDYALGDDTALSLVRHGYVGDIATGAFHRLITDHRPLVTVLHLPYSSQYGPARPPPKRLRRLVKWRDVSKDQLLRFKDGLDAATACSGLAGKIRSGLASGTPWADVGRSPDAAVATVLGFMRHAESLHVGESFVDSSRITDQERARWWTPAVAAAHEVYLACHQDVVRRTHERDAAGVAEAEDLSPADVAAEVALVAAQVEFEDSSLSSQTALAADALLFAGPRVHPARRQHDLFRRVTSGLGRSPMHVFNAVQNSAGDIVTDGDVEPVLAEWMSRYHALDPDDSRYDSAFLRRILGWFDSWRRNAAAAECAQSRVSPEDTTAWRRWEAARDAEMESGTWDPGSYSHADFMHSASRDFCVADVLDALKAAKTGTAPSPDDEVVMDALNAAGPEFHGLVAVLFTAVLVTGQLPSSWTVGFVQWLHKKGSMIDPQQFRGIVLTSLLGKTMERCMLIRLQRWLRFKRLIPLHQSATQRKVSVVTHLSKLHSAAAFRYGQGKSTMSLFLDVKGAFPSVISTTLQP